MKMMGGLFPQVSQAGSRASAHQQADRPETNLPTLGGRLLRPATPEGSSVEWGPLWQGGV